MKNIHLLPTEKESRLTTNALGRFVILNGRQHQEVNINHHIYITSDEDLKEGDWFLLEGQNEEGVFELFKNDGEEGLIDGNCKKNHLNHRPRLNCRWCTSY